MIDKKDKEGKVLIGPWGEPKAKNDADADKWIKEKYDRELNKKNTQLKMKEKLSRVDMITENIMIQLIHTLGEYDYEIGKDDFILDVGFLSETVKAVISRQERIPHVVQGLIDNLHGQFLSVVEKERNIPIDKVTELANGQVYSGKQAVDNGLIDMLGTFEDAVLVAAQKSGHVEEPEIVYPPEEKKGLLDMLFGDIFQRSTIGNLLMFPTPEYKLPYTIR